MPIVEKLETWDTYQSAWAEMAPEDRRGLLARSVADDCVYSDPTSHCEGVDALIAKIEDSQVNVPGATFRNDKLVDHHDEGLSNWTMFDGNGDVFATGTSYARFGHDGRLTQMTGFFET